MIKDGRLTPEVSIVLRTTYNTQIYINYLYIYLNTNFHTFILLNICREGSVRQSIYFVNSL